MLLIWLDLHTMIFIWLDLYIAIIKSADMKDDLQKEANDCAISAFDKHNVEKDVDKHIKNELDDLLEKKIRSSKPLTLDWQAFKKHNVEKDVAEHIKKEFDKKHGPIWHRNFGKPITPISKYSSITISEGIFLIRNEFDDLHEKKTRSSNPFTLDWQLKCPNYGLECCQWFRF
ncbi:hypothetical protein GIB67_002132 [Kingdonia uniflora]|uniref:Dynein light chain n=1 Tax=Kingdonia uniflora TaxID=39325 RepID=A0A7J7KWJ2_9MAGN|nr:hypothetical protein GIB67_002132 [Kingdonia uniflora]